jgi:hypothetical protein
MPALVVLKILGDNKNTFPYLDEDVFEQTIPEKRSVPRLIRIHNELCDIQRMRAILRYHAKHALMQQLAEASEHLVSSAFTGTRMRDHDAQRDPRGILLRNLVRHVLTWPFLRLLPARRQRPWVLWGTGCT